MIILFEIILLILLLVAVFIIFVGEFLYKLNIKRFIPSQKQIKDEEKYLEAHPSRKSAIKWLSKKDMQAINIKSKDKLNLVGFLLKNEVETHKWVCLVHGWHGTHTEMADYARMFYKKGFNILMPDLRGHGASEGGYEGFGYHDSEDILLWINEILKMKAEEIVLMGHSMGAATVMMAGSKDLPENVKCIIEDSGYSSLYSQFYRSIRKVLKHCPEVLINILIKYVDFISIKRCGYSVYSIDCVKSVSEIKLPMLFIHGEADDFVPFSMFDKIHNACKTEKMIFTVKNAMHVESIEKANAEYSEKIDEFLNKINF